MPNASDIIGANNAKRSHLFKSAPLVVGTLDDVVEAGEVAFNVVDVLVVVRIAAAGKNVSTTQCVLFLRIGRPNTAEEIGNIGQSSRLWCSRQPAALGSSNAFMSMHSIVPLLSPPRM